MNTFEQDLIEYTNSIVKQPEAEIIIKEPTIGELVKYNKFRFRIALAENGCVGCRLIDKCEAPNTLFNCLSVTRQDKLPVILK